MSIVSMNTVERGVVANEKDIRNGDDGIETGRGDGSRASVPGG
jgi:hypothetical protein